jgi:hypothetical protein
VETTCGGAGDKTPNTLQSKGFDTNRAMASGVAGKTSFGGKLPYFLDRKQAERRGLSAVRHFRIAPILVRAEIVPRGTLTVLGRFPKVFHVEQLSVAK